jgi:hypothetical protein
MVTRGMDPKPIPDQVEYVLSHVLAPPTSEDPARRLNDLCDRLWLIAAIEHDTAVLGVFALNCAWDDHGARTRPSSICSDGSDGTMLVCASRARQGEHLTLDL